jgi:hypothetical protein
MVADRRATGFQPDLGTDRRTQTILLARPGAITTAQPAWTVGRGLGKAVADGMTTPDGTNATQTDPAADTTQYAGADHEYSSRISGCSSNEWRQATSLQRPAQPRGQMSEPQPFGQTIPLPPLPSKMDEASAITGGFRCSDHPDPGRRPSSSRSAVRWELPLLLILTAIIIVCPVFHPQG